MVLFYKCHAIWHVQTTVENILGNFDKRVKQFQVLIPKTKSVVSLNIYKNF